jgi:hypothetical protein
MLKVANVRMPVGESEENLSRHGARRLKVRPEAIRSLRILRKALDIRDKRRIERVYTLAVELEGEERLLARLGDPQIVRWAPSEFEIPDPGPKPLAHRPVVIGAGPAGLFAAWLLATRGYQPILLERGREVGRRIPDVKAFDTGGTFDPESNYLFGEGGAGTFSDGKLTCRTAGPEIDVVLRVIAEHKGKPEVVYEAKPHLGSNRLPAVVKALRRSIEAHGGEIRFGARVTDLEVTGAALSALRLADGERLGCDAAVLAIGHSARDTYRMLLARGVPMVARPFQMGVRIEHPQENVTRAQYGEGPHRAWLGPADYTMNVRAGDRDLFSFCMCAGGYIMPSVSHAGFFCTNGMSRSMHESPMANSGLVVTIDPARLPGDQSDPLLGIRYQELIEAKAYELGNRDYDVPIQWARDFLARRSTTDSPPSSYPRRRQPVNLWELLPEDVATLIADGLPKMDRQWNGLFLKDATLVGPEARGSCPVRIPRDPTTFESIGVAGLYPSGEGAGYAGGIVSAAADGLRAARALIGSRRLA